MKNMYKLYSIQVKLECASVDKTWFSLWGKKGQLINNHFRRKNHSLANCYIRVIRYFVFLHVIALCAYYFWGHVYRTQYGPFEIRLPQRLFCFVVVSILFLCFFYIFIPLAYVGLLRQSSTNNPNRISRPFSFIVVYLSFCCGIAMANRAPDEPYSIICDPEVIHRVG